MSIEDEAGPLEMSVEAFRALGHHLVERIAGFPAARLFRAGWDPREEGLAALGLIFGRSDALERPLASGPCPRYAQRQTLAQVVGNFVRDPT